MIKKLIASKSHEVNILNCLEELAELIQAVSKYERYRMLGKISELPKLRANVLEELSDTLISTEIIGTLFSFKPEELAGEIDSKMKRNLERIG